MKFLCCVLTAVTLVSVSVCKRRGLALNPEDEMPILKKEVVGRVFYPTETTANGAESRANGAETQTRANGAETRANGAETTANAAKKRANGAETTADGAETTTTMGKPSTHIKIPESLLIEMNDIRSADEFLRRFVASEPRDQQEVHNSTNTGFSIISGHTTGINSRKGFPGEGNLQVTPFAGCNPKEQPVKLENTADDDSVLMWPSCVSVRRCGGCCTSEMLTCRPTATSYVNVTVLHARYNGLQGKGSFVNDGLRAIPVEQHDSCSCECKELPQHCTRNQEYRKNECRCVCSNHDEATRCQIQSKKFWDSRDCSCKCRQTVDCSSGFFFNIKTCRCEVLRLSYISHLDFHPYEKGNVTSDVQYKNVNSTND